MPGERQYIVTGTPNGEGEVTTNKLLINLKMVLLGIQE
jgi:hypothetical protein